MRSFPGGEPVVGEVTTQRSGTLEVRDEEGAVHSIALGQVSELERSVGGKPSDAAGPAALVGVLAGVIVGSSANATRRPEQWTDVPLRGDAPEVRWRVVPRLDGSVTLGISLRASR